MAKAKDETEEKRHPVQYLKEGESAWIEEDQGATLGAVKLAGRHYVQGRSPAQAHSEWPEAALFMKDGQLVLQVPENPGERQVSKARLHHIPIPDLVHLLKLFGHQPIV